jgi:TRAP-type mannitol/chloroaromatic compound transport system permease small subunit
MIALFTTIMLHVPNWINSIVETFFLFTMCYAIYYTSIKIIVNEKDIGHHEKLHQ